MSRPSSSIASWVCRSLLSGIASTNSEWAIAGRGRSTRALILISLVQRWLKSVSFTLPSTSPPRSSYTVINNLIRTIRYGQEIKARVDEAVTACGSYYDLIESVEDARAAAEDAGDNVTLKAERIQRGITSLRAYYFLILFAAFLHETKAKTWRDLRETASYESWVKARPVFKTIERELDSSVGLEALVALDKPTKSGMAQSDEIYDFVAARAGRILSSFTLLKSDYFVRIFLPLAVIYQLI